jgi:hypothetical protein
VEIRKGAYAARGLKDHISPGASGAAACFFLMGSLEIEESYASIAPVTCFDIDFCFIVKHGTLFLSLR